jgi:excisionase family DNA binding protein
MEPPLQRDTRLPLDPYRTPTLSVEQAGTYLGVKRSGAYDLVRCGALPTIKLNGRFVVRTADLMAMLGLPLPPTVSAQFDA